LHHIVDMVEQIRINQFAYLVKLTISYNYNCFMALWILSGTT